jgi:hypothetical protein
MEKSAQKELKGSSVLLKPDGALTEVGWSRQPALDCNLEFTRTTALRFWQPFRLKRWDYYGVTTPTHYFSFTVSDVGYIGSIFAYVLEFATGIYHEETLTVPLARGVSLPRNSTSGLSRFSNGKIDLQFEIRKTERIVTVDWPQFSLANGKKEPLTAQLRYQEPAGQDSMVIVIPIRGKRFYYNRKINCLPVEGVIHYSGKQFDLHPEQALGNLDWGRGVWEYNSFWVWASASGYLPGGQRLGLNLGFGFGDTSAATENAVILDGRIHKLGQVDFQYDSKDFMRPWKMTSPDGRLNLEFCPFFERVAKTDLKLLRSEVHQMFGRYSGYAISDSGEKVVIEDLVGFAEEHHAKW